MSNRVKNDSKYLYFLIKIFCFKFFKPRETLEFKMKNRNLRDTFAKLYVTGTNNFIVTVLSSLAFRSF
ncbi:MAG: hypothetical protein CM15mP58_23360 [Burkholderiaceae bacterium]|nr:MAG: hypothetical protein CM15mP58_23360 [Burkholderiaceae bacterium]